MSSLLLLNLILLFNVICGFVPESNEDDFDPIIYYLLNGNRKTELLEPNIESNINLGMYIFTVKFYIFRSRGKVGYS